MNIGYAIRRMAFYAQWYKDMDRTERQSVTGLWVLGRMDWFSQAINDELGKSRRTVGRYAA